MTETFLPDGTVLRIINFRYFIPEKCCNTCHYFKTRFEQTDRREEAYSHCEAVHKYAGDRFNTDFEGGLNHICDTWKNRESAND